MHAVLQVRDLEVKTRFRIGEERYELLLVNGNRALVQPLRTIKHVRLPNGREFDRRAKKTSISPTAIVDEVLES